MRTIGLITLGILTAAFILIGSEGVKEFYLAAFISAALLLRLASGSVCPLVWILNKLGVKGMACPATDEKKDREPEQK